MLRFSKAIESHIPERDLDLNTSHVTVQHMVLCGMNAIDTNLNTSHVTVQLTVDSPLSRSNADLNTSHVTVQQI